MTASYCLGPDRIEVFSETEIEWMGAAVERNGARYVPIAMADGRMGYCVCSLDGSQQEFLYLEPSALPSADNDENEADCKAMDGLAAMLNEYHEDGSEWDHSEICNELVKALQGTGRTVQVDDDEPESVEQLRSEGR
jgi:hypothetical protein